MNVPFFLARILRSTSRYGCSGDLRVNKMADEQDRTGRSHPGRTHCALQRPGLLIFTLTATFAMIDWVLSADTRYFSTVYGAMILIGDILQTFALTIIVMILVSRGDRFGGRINAPILHDWAS